MKKAKIFIVVILAAMTCFIFYETAFAGHTTKLIGSSAYDHQFPPQINDAGQVVWIDPTYSVVLYSGSETTQNLGFAAGPAGRPQINNSGQVVWEGYDGNNSEIYLYSGGVTSQLTENSFDDSDAQITDSGEVAWAGFDGTDWEIYIYNDGVTTQLTNNSLDDRNPQINDNGQVVWFYDNSGIFLYSTGVTSQLSSNAVWGISPQINNRGQVVWNGGDYYGTDNEIFLYSDGVTTQLTSNGNDDWYPQINDSGQVVWQSGYWACWQIFLYNGGITTQLTNNNVVNEYPRINDNGQVVWDTYDSNNYTHPDIFLYSAGVTSQLSSNDAWGIYPQINNSGHVVWDRNDWNESGSDVFLSTPCTGSRPDLSLSKNNVYWASYADYQARLLTVNMTIHNNGFRTAYNVNTTDVSNTGGVITRSMAGGISGFAVSGRPATCPDCPGGSAEIYIVVEVPVGVTSFRQTVSATAEDDCGNTYEYPGLPPSA